MVTTVKQHAQSDTNQDKRAFKRYSINLNAAIQFGDKNGHLCTVRDVCTGGMYLCFENSSELVTIFNKSKPALYENIKITCTVTPKNKRSKTLVFAGDIVRTEQFGFAVRFIDPDLASLLYVQEFAKAEMLTQEKALSENKDNTASQLYNGKTGKQLLEICDEELKSILSPIITIFQNKIVDEIFEATKRTKNTIELNDLYDALRIINEQKDKLKDTFIETASKLLHNYSPENLIQKTEKQSKEEYDLDNLSIVADEEFDDWLADTSTVDSIESQCRASLNEIERRLSVLHNTEIKKENNPYGPSLFTKAFHKATSSLNMNHTVNMIFYAAYKNILTQHLYDFYIKINKILKDNEVLPVIHHKLAKPKKQKESTTHSTNTGTSDLKQNTTTTDNSTSAAGHIELDLYELVGELHTLQQQISQRPGSIPVGDEIQNIINPATGSDNNNVTTASYSADDVVKALSNLDLELSNNTDNTSKEVDYKAAIISALQNKDNPENNKSIGVRETRIIDVACNVFQSMISDMQLTEKVRDWIKQLELPILTMALVDDTVFTNRSHIVRQVINKIAQLEVMAGETDQASLQIIKRAIDWIIELVKTEFNGSTDVFKRAINQLDLLLKSQDETYNKNINKVVKTITQEEQQLEANNKIAETRDNIDVDWENIDKTEKSSWIKKANRLKDGDWLLFEPESTNPLRLRIAWFAPNTQRFVLVNLAGKKDKILHTEEMAKHLHDSSVQLIDNASEPAMDRAQSTMLQELHTKLLYQNSHDLLTGLISRKEFINKVERAITDTRAQQQRHVIGFIDLDQFSMINNVCGYEGGDKLITDVSVIFNSVIDDRGTLSRFTGDKFALLLDDCTLDEALDITEEILDALSEFRFSWDKKRFTTSCSIGLAPVTTRTLDQESTALIQQAEASCVIAKDLGGNRIQIYSKEHEKLVRRDQVMKWAAEIDRILDEETLYLRCQQILPLDNNNKMKHYEILLGVWNTEGGDVVTIDFIEAAERYNRMPDVDKWVLKNAFRWIAENHQKLDDIDMFSINLSGLSLNDETFKNFVIDEMQATNVPAEKICFEVTETAGVSSLSDATEFITDIKKTGCQFSLDDFGTGMSSYAYLKNMPVDYLKIDGTFVKDMLSNPCDYAVVKSICELGQFMGKKVIAEFVENDEIMEKLREIGIDYGQGYGIEKPRLLKDLI